MSHRLAKWKPLSTRHVYSNKWISVREDMVALPDGRSTIYGVVTLGDCVGILPITDDDQVVLIRQYRYVQAEVSLEIPTGKAYHQETMPEAAQRELQEEAGVRAGQLTLLGQIHTSKSVCSETAYLYLARHLEQSALPPDETEFMEIVTMPFAEVLRLVQQSVIRDAMSVAAILHYALLSGTGNKRQ